MTEMSPTSFIAVILGFWSSFHLVHTFLLNSTSFGHNVASLLINFNISISYFHIRWFTARWNRYFIRMGRMWNSKLKIWFDSGIIFAAIAMVVGTILLVHTLYVTMEQVFFPPLTPVPDKQVLSVIVPGVNLPIQDIWYLLPSIFLSGILHELGHAVAAAREGVHINGFGIFALFIYPGAFVDLSSDDMNRKDPVCRLRVYCAGVWHNFIICLITFGLILALPTLLYPFYTTNGEGVLVTYQMPESPLRGNNGLREGDYIVKIDSCNVANVSDWLYCINKTKKTAQWGSCMSLTQINSVVSHTAYTSEKQISHGTSPDRRFWMDCCDGQAPQTHLCYHYTTQTNKDTMFGCLPGRVMVSAQDDCMANEDCHNTKANHQNDTVCTKAYTEPHFKFIRLVTLRENSEKHNVLYIGEPVDILRSVTVSEMFPRFSMVPLRLPSIVQKFLQYIFSMSGALALLNIVPCYALDGQWAFKAFLDYIDDGRRLPQHAGDFLYRVVLFLGTALLVANIFFGFVHLFTR